VSNSARKISIWGLPTWSRDRAVGIVNPLRAGRSEDRIPLRGGGEIFWSCPDRPCAPLPLISCKWVPGVKPPGCGVDHPLPSRAEAKERLELYLYFPPVAYRGGGLGGSNLPEIPKALQNRAKLNPIWKLIKIAEFRTPTPQDFRKKGSKILKLPPVRNCFTLAMTNKLVVIINSHKVPKIKKILLYEMKFLVPNYSCLQNPWLGGYRPQIPVLSVLCQLNLLNPPSPPPNKIPGYATVFPLGSHNLG